MNGVAQHNLPPRWLEKAFYLFFALLPWSIDVDFGSWNMVLPAEPLIALIGFGMLWTLLIRRPQTIQPLSPSKTQALKHPGTQTLKHSNTQALPLAWILWMGICTAFSSMPMVSLKYWVVEVGHWWVFACSMAFWPGLWLRALPFLMMSMTGMVVYTVLHHSLFHFRVDQAMLAPMPFFSDHTLYAAVLALLLFFVQSQQHPEPGFMGQHLQKTGVRQAITALFTLGLLLSTCRAAILSVAMAGLLAVGYYWRKRPGYLLFVAVLATGLFFFRFDPEKFRIKLAQDVSFQERLNRWDCAASMLAARPWTGFGPGTYPFQYIPFQQPDNITRISIQRPLLDRGPDTYGRGGGAHSEYWQSAAELGWVGSLIWIALVCCTLWAGLLGVKFAALSRCDSQKLWLLLGLFTFFIHAFFNNFLHDSRVAALFWGGMMAIQSMRHSSERVEY